jgi:hypothetical protein
LEIEKARVLVSHIRTSGALALDIEELEISNVNSTSTIVSCQMGYFNFNKLCAKGW